MESVLVELRHGGARIPSTVVHLQPGARAVFGRCGCAGCGLDIVMAGEAVPRRAGVVTAADDHWRLTNLSQTTSCVVEHLEDSGQYVTVAPGRSDAPIPFELARIVLPGAPSMDKLIVFASWTTLVAESPPVHDCVCDPTASTFSLDPSAKYFLVLVALCEPRLRSVGAAEVPTARDIALRLKALPSCRELSESAVQFHIDYLVHEKLRLLRPSEGGQRVGWKRLALATAAMRHGLVRSEHLGLLPQRVLASSRALVG